jgi:hypothetical protein
MEKFSVFIVNDMLFHITEIYGEGRRPLLGDIPALRGHLTFKISSGQ